ncbi:MAG TPA: hypothetical protein VK712_01265 [Verrucomicrobiae bacterium]|jgi:uncharacterized membrane-anchored protein|nr:hypothetical protein [Verrucomicrobiae bacterium]
MSESTSQYRASFAQPGRHARQALRKVPEITVFFWIVKLLTTAMGEATSDFLVFRINPYIAVILGGVALAGALLLQFWVRKYIASVYWLAVAMVAVFGTMAADVLHIQFGVPYIATTLFFAVVLAGVFITWCKYEKTLSIHSINTRRRELFYWATVLATFALGTAAGDMTATTLGLGYFSSGLLFAGLIVIPALGYWLLGLNEIFAFWFAYVLTRPLGASFADWMGKPHSVGGLGWGDGHVSLMLSALIVVFVVYLSMTHKDIKA